MNNIVTYYIPINNNISKGPIYTLYVNNNKNLDLTSILEENNLTLNNMMNTFKENKIILEKSDYDELIRLNNDFSNFINNIKSNQENINRDITKLVEINNKYTELINNFIDERKV